MFNLSIVIPVYNVEKYLRKCIDSAITPDKLGQEYEIVVVNDGSTDSSPEIIKEYVSAYPGSIRMISTENFGLGHARNVGIRNSGGEYLFFMDSDDYLVPGAVYELLSMAESGCDVCIFDASSVREDGSVLEYKKGFHTEGALSLSDCPELLLEIPNVWNKLFKRRLFEDKEIFFPDHAWFEDIRTVLKLYAAADRMEYRALDLYRYVQHSNTITRSRNPGRNIEMIEAMDDIIGFFRDEGKYEEFKDILEYLAFHSQFLTSPVRANLAQWDSDVQGKLIDDYLQKFPDFQRNPYVKKISSAHKLLTKLYLKKRYLAVHILMKANSIVKGTNF